MLLLLAHLLGAVLCVALSTHLCWWLRGLAKKRRSLAAARTFARYTLAAYVASMLIGLLLYPKYRIEVRAEYLENPSAISAASARRTIDRERASRQNQLSMRHRSGTPGMPEPEASDTSDPRLDADLEARIARGVKLARWFDVKEHWAALGLLLYLALALLLHRAYTPQTERWIFALACGGCALTWAAAIIGAVLSASRSVVAL